jgi:hypothetical protein
VLRVQLGHLGVVRGVLLVARPKASRSI